MTPDQNELIVIPGLENSSPVAFTPLQMAMKPYVPAFEIFWWCIWIGTFLYVATVYVVRPLLKK